MPAQAARSASRLHVRGWSDERRADPGARCALPMRPSARADTVRRARSGSRKARSPQPSPVDRPRVRRRKPTRPFGRSRCWWCRLGAGGVVVAVAPAGWPVAAGGGAPVAGGEGGALGCGVQPGLVAEVEATGARPGPWRFETGAAGHDPNLPTITDSFRTPVRTVHPPGPPWACGRTRRHAPAHRPPAHRPPSGCGRSRRDTPVVARGDTRTGLGHVRIGHNRPRGRHQARALATKRELWHGTGADPAV